MEHVLFEPDVFEGRWTGDGACANIRQCADIMFNSTATLLSDDQCQNGTGVSGIAIENVASGTEQGSPGASTTPTGAASRLSLSPALGTGLFAAVLTWGLL
jgi:hypothetical protein